MGYDAYVKCNCYKDNKLKSKPPHEAFVKENEEGLFLDLDWETNIEKHNDFWAWEQSNPCEHEYMEACTEHLANISGMAAFRALVAELGKERFPILNTYLPTFNGGFLPAELSKALHIELMALNSPSKEILIALKEITTDETIGSVNVNSLTPLVISKGCNFSLSKYGLQITEQLHTFNAWSKNTIFFTSKHFTQQKIAENTYLYSDLKTNKTYQTNIFLKQDNEQVLEFKTVHQQVLISEEYAYIIEPLLRLSFASLKTNNPIVWC